MDPEGRKELGLSGAAKCDRVYKTRICGEKEESGVKDAVVIQQFRTALGGFNRQDVQDYMDQMAAAHRGETEELQKRLDKAERRAQELEEAMPDAVGAVDEANRLRTELDSSKRAAARLRGELTQAECGLAAARQEIERLRGQVEILEPLAASYREMRDRAANVELDAHHRAREAVSEARAEADRVRADTRRWLASVLEQYDQLRRGMEQMLAQAKAVVGAGERLEPMDAAAQRLKKLGASKEAGAVKREQEAVK